MEMKSITLEYGGKEYTLGFTRTTARMMENRGFVVSEISEKPHTMIPMLFQGAFLAKHRNVTGKLVNEIYNSLTGRSALIGKLIESYQDTLTTLFDETDDDEDEGNQNWTANW